METHLSLPNHQASLRPCSRHLDKPYSGSRRRTSQAALVALGRVPFPGTMGGCLHSKPPARVAASFLPWGPWSSKGSPIYGRENDLGVGQAGFQQRRLACADAWPRDKGMSGLSGTQHRPCATAHRHEDSETVASNYARWDGIE